MGLKYCQSDVCIKMIILKYYFTILPIESVSEFCRLNLIYE